MIPTNSLIVYFIAQRIVGRRNAIRKFKVSSPPPPPHLTPLTVLTPRCYDTIQSQHWQHWLIDFDRGIVSGNWRWTVISGNHGCQRRPHKISMTTTPSFTLLCYTLLCSRQSSWIMQMPHTSRYSPLSFVLDVQRTRLLTKTV